MTLLIFLNPTMDFDLYDVQEGIYYILCNQQIIY